MAWPPLPPMWLTEGFSLLANKVVRLFGLVLSSAAMALFACVTY